MSLLNRNDGVQFVVQAYRERIAIGKRSVMVQRLRLLSEQHGQYVMLFPLGQDAIEAVFSRESGYLLGETVWHHFGKPSYLIFCERLSNDNNQVLLVVVRANEVYLDILVDNDKLRNELLPLMTMPESFRVITYGDVSLKQGESLETGQFSLPKNLVTQFEESHESVFKNLPVLPSARLLTLLLAIKSPLLGSRFSPAIVMAASALVLLLAWGIYAVSPHSHKPVITKVIAQQPNLAFVDFYAAMNTPAPKLQLREFAKVIQTFYGLPGWQAADIRYEGNGFQVQLNRLGGTLQWLTQWAETQNYGLNLSSKGAEVIVPSRLIARVRPKAVYPLAQVMASLIDRLDLLFPNQAIGISDSKVLGQTKSRTLTISFTDASPDTLILIGDTLGDNLPLSIAAMNVSVRSGLLNGSVQLSVWGI